MKAKLASAAKLEILICAGLLIALAGPAGAENLLKNAGFEEIGADGVPAAWQRDFNPVLTGPFRVVADAYEGKQAVQLMTEEWILDRPQFIVQDVKLPAGAKAMRLAAWCKGQGFMRLSIQFRKGNQPLKSDKIKEYFGEYDVPQETTGNFGLHPEYQEYEVYAAVPEGADGVRVRLGNTLGEIYLVNVWGTAWIDSVTLTPGGAVKASVTQPTQPVTPKPPPMKGLQDIAIFARIITDPPSFNPKALVGDLPNDDDLQFGNSFGFIDGPERCPSLAFLYPEPVTVNKVCIKLRGNVSVLDVRGDAAGTGRFDQVLARVEGLAGQAGWLAVELPEKPMRALRIDAIQANTRGYHSTIPFATKVKILAREETVKPLLGKLQQSAVYRIPGSPSGAAAHLMLDPVDFPLPATSTKKFGKILVTDMWMFGVNVKKDTKSSSLNVERVVQTCKLVGFDAVCQFMEDWSSPIVPWSSKICNCTDENIIKALADALHANGIKLYMMPCSATCPPFDGSSIFVYPKEESSRYPQMKQFPSIVHGPHYRDNWLAMLEENLASGADGVMLCPDETYYKGHFMETFPKDDPGRALYKQRFGKDLPLHEEDSLAFRQWIELRHEGVADLYAYWKKHLRAKYPNAYLGSRFMQPYNCASYVSDFGLPMDILGARDAVDHISSDYCGPYGIQMMAAANGWRRGAMCYDANMWGPLQGAPRKREICIIGEILWGAMYGLGAIEVYRENYLYEQGTLPMFARGFGLLRDLEKLGVYDARPAKKIALLTSRASLDWWQIKAWWGRHDDPTPRQGSGQDWDRGVEGGRGWFAERQVFNLLRRANLPFDWMYLDRDDQLKDLDQYKALVVPFAWSISKSAAEKVKAAAAKGTKVIFLDGKLGPTDEWGEPYAAPVFQELADSGKALVFKEDIMREGVTDVFADKLRKAVTDALGSESPLKAEVAGQDIEITALQKSPAEQFVFIINWEKSNMQQVDLGLNLPAGNYEVFARDANFWHSAKLGGSKTLTAEQLRNFRVWMSPESVYVLYVRPVK